MNHKPKVNRKGRINSFPPKQRHTEPQGQIISCSCTLAGVTVHKRDVPKLKGGFTLLEIMIVVCIIGILSAIAVPSLVKRIEYARAIATLKNTATVNTAIQDVMIRAQVTETTFGAMVDYPDRLEAVESLLTGGYAGIQVSGYILDLEALNNAYISIIAFRGIEPADLYIKL